MGLLHRKHHSEHIPLTSVILHMLLTTPQYPRATILLDLRHPETCSDKTVLQLCEAAVQ